MQELEALQDLFQGFSLNTNLLTWAVFAGILLDFVTGIVKGYKTAGAFSSSKLRDGMFKKAGIILVIILSYGLSLLFNDSTRVIFNGVQAYYIYTELISVLENLDQLGVRLPGFLKKLMGDGDRHGDS